MGGGKSTALESTSDTLTSSDYNSVHVKLYYILILVVFCGYF
jgi:hypothetical protein